MLTYEQALIAPRFHYSPVCEMIATGAKGYKYPETYRRNGKTQTWKRSPGKFRIPTKYGMYSYLQITNGNAPDFHVEDDCPLKVRA